MSRSKRRTPIMGVAGNSPAQKRFKQQEHQRERALVRTLINKIDELPDTRKLFGNEWSSPRDGKMWFGKCITKWPDDYPKWMRK